MTSTILQATPRRSVPVGLTLLLSLALVVPASTAQTQRKGQDTSAALPSKPSQAAGSLRTIIQSGRLDDLRWPDFSDYRVHVDSFYGPTGYGLAWIEDGKATKRATEMVEIFSRADREGLNSGDYDGPQWSERFARLEQQHTSPDEARFDLALTVCAMRYISDVRIGRVNPKHFKFGLDIEHKKLNLASFLRELIAEQGSIDAELAKIEPPFKEYKDTRELLLRYEALAKEDDGQQLPPPPGIAFVGSPYDGIARLTALLRRLGDLPADVVVPADEKTYSEPLSKAVKKFQQRHGIAPDGYLTKETVAQLNVPLSDRVEQLRLALERYRWLRYEFTQPPVVVNLPEFRLRGFDGEGKVGLAMTVNIGDAYDFQTPVFENSIRYLVFRPYWNVPPRILRDEVIPDIQNDRNYVHDGNMEVTTIDGKVVAAGAISDSVLQQLRAGKLTVRENPGPENALGLLKVIFPNEHHVYLHDTPASRDMFSGGPGAQSHGCIHLQKPAEFAAWLLRDKPEWTLARVEQAMHEGRDNFTVNLTNPVPILIIYTTAIVEENGDVHFYRDIYGHDAALETALAKGYPYPK